MYNSDYIDEIALKIDSLKASSLYRETKVPKGGRDFTSNDYLGLLNIASPVKQIALRGAVASRVLSGTSESHMRLEEALASYAGTESALLFGSGYLANLGTLSALVGRKDLVFSDKYSHRSLLDGIQLSGAKHLRFKHNDLDHLEGLLKKAIVSRREKQNYFIVTESVFSMDGDLAPLSELVALARKYSALLIIDEAHAVGVYGSGRCKAEGVLADMLAVLGTCSKSFCGYGGFFLGPQIVREYLVNKASSFIFSTALPSDLCDVLIENIELIKNSPRLGQLALEKAEYFRGQLETSGLNKHCSLVGESKSHIVPFVLGEEKKVLELKNALAERNILVAAIRPPTVPSGTARIRFSIRADHSLDDLDAVISIMREIFAN